ncbi:hypothetical protein ACFL1X_03120 [Candidatus Hydrogenedentota bacterium]
MRSVISSPPPELKRILASTHLKAARESLDSMRECRNTGDVAGFFRELNLRFRGWTWHWVKCLMIENDRFIDVPKALVRRSATLTHAPDGVSTALEALFALDLTPEGMKEAIRICHCLTEDIVPSDWRTEQPHATDE